MDCNNSTLRIVRGNDFSVRVKVLRAVKQEDGTTEYVQVELSKCSNIITRLVSRIGRRVELMYTIDGEELLVDFDGSLSSTVYGFEVVGKYEDGHDWRYYAKPGEFLEIVEPTSAASGLEGDGAVEPTGPLAWNAPVLSETLSAQQVEEMRAATDNANASAEAANTAADKANEAAAKAEESADNANKMAEDATQAATNANNAATTATEAATNADTIAEGAKATAEDAATLVETTTTKEQEREEAEGKRVAAETARDEAEDKRVTAEEGRTTTEAARAKSEADRAAAESSRVNAESARATAEGKRVSAESARATAEQGRVSAESSRANAESTRATAESGRASAESSRAKAETARASAESARATAEQKRVDAEAARVSAETKREAATTAAIEEMKTNTETAVTNCNEAADKAEEATEGAEKVNADFVDGKIVITNRDGEQKTVDSKDMKETVNVTITSDVADVTLSGVTLNVYLNHGGTPQQYVTNASGKVSFDVAWGNYYEVAFPDKAGCKHVDPIGYTATIGSRDITVDYEEYTAEESEAVTVTVTKRQDGESIPWAGATVHVKIGTTTTDYTTDESGNVNFTVELNTQYTVSMDSDVNGWYTHKQDYVKTYTAKAVTRQVWFTWYPYRTGVFIVGTDGVEYTEEEWDASGLDASEAQLIKCVTESLVSGSGVIYVPLDDIVAQAYPNKQWSIPQWDIAGIPNNQSSENYFNGVVSTDLILASAEEQGGEVPAADYCRSQSIVNGGVTMTGYLGSVGQWQQLWLNRDGVDAWIKKIKGEDATLFSTFTKTKWASTQFSASYAMYFGSSPGNGNKGLNLAAVPFFAY